MIKLITPLIFFLLGVLTCQQSVFTQSPEPKTVYFRINAYDSKGDLVKGLSKENFIIKEEKIEQDITFFSKEDEPANVLMMFDISSGININVRQAAVKAALKFVQISNEKNDYSFIAFGNDVYQLANWGITDNQIVESLNKIANLNLKGEKEKVLFKACGVAFDNFKNSKHQKKVLIIFSEQRSLEGGKAFKDIKEIAKRNDVMIYTVVLPNQYDKSSPSDELGYKFGHTNYDLGDLAKITNGRSFYSIQNVKYDEMIERMNDLIKFQYVIGYKSNRKVDKDSWQKVEIKFKQIPNTKEKIDVWKIYSRDGYYRE